MLTLTIPIYAPPGTEKHVHDCLDSLEGDSSALSRCETFVVLNGPCDRKLRGRLKRFATQLAEYVNPIGWTAALNLAITATAGDVIQMNSDVQVNKGWLDLLVIEADQTTGITCVTDQLLNMPPGIHKDRGWGALFYLPRYVVNKVGLFDEDAFPYRYSDADYWIRAKQAGFDVVVTGNVRMQHVNSPVFKQMVANDAEIANRVALEKRKMLEKYGAVGFASWLKNQGSAA